MTPPTRTQNVYLFAGGGTGGHLYPGLAIAAELRKIDPSCRCVFLCSDRAIDAKILDVECAERVVIPAKPPTVRPVGLMKFALSWGRSIRAARGVMRRVRDEARAGGAEARLVMAAMGGFVAAPAVQAAQAERVPVVLVNLDAVPGKANRWIAKHAAGTGARLSATGPAGEGSRVPSAWEAIPPIVRESVVARESREACRGKLGLDPLKPLLFVTGGSQGAGSINALMLALARERADALRGWQVFHQCGMSGEEELCSAYAAAGIAARVVPFWNDMASAWGAAELAVSRCGAGAVAEVWANAVPTVFLPYPYHKDEHQRINALPLERAGGAVIVRDDIDAAKNLASAGSRIMAMLCDTSRRESMRGALRALGPANGAAVAAQRLHRAGNK